jgi:cytochrome c oxidase cbb3-type subunit 3
MKVIKKIKGIAIIFLLFIFSSPIFAQSANNTDDGYGTIIKVMIAIIAFLVAIVLWLALVYSDKDSKGAKAGENTKSKGSWWSSMNYDTSIEDEQSILLEHDFDGIKELNNKIPPWYNVIFIGSIIFAVIYGFRYHWMFDGDYQEYEYQQELAEASAAKKELTKGAEVIDENTATLLTDDTSISNGKATFIKNCAACHAQDGGGLVGPNFTDNYWIHGNKVTDLFKIIKYGVPAKGMVSWQSQLSPKQIQEVASYILTLQGTTPANPKAPEGDLYE